MARGRFERGVSPPATGAAPAWKAGGVIPRQCTVHRGTTYSILYNRNCFIYWKHSMRTGFVIIVGTVIAIEHII